MTPENSERKRELNKHIERKMEKNRSEQRREDNHHKRHSHHINMFLILTIILVILVVAMVKPAFLGYKISQQFEEIGMTVPELLKNTELLKSNLLISETNLNSCKILNDEYLSQLSSEKNVTFKYLNEKNSLGFEIERQKSDYENELRQQKLSYENNITQLTSGFEQKISELDAKLVAEQAKSKMYEEKYTPIINSAAQNICCKSKIDNPNIDSYMLSNNKIVCTVGEKDKISC